MLVVGHDHGNMAVGSIVLSVVPIGKLIGTRKSEFAGTPPLSVVMRTIWVKSNRLGGPGRRLKNILCGLRCPVQYTYRLEYLEQ